MEGVSLGVCCPLRQGNFDQWSPPGQTLGRLYRPTADEDHPPSPTITEQHHQCCNYTTLLLTMKPVYISIILLPQGCQGQHREHVDCRAKWKDDSAGLALWEFAHDSRIQSLYWPALVDLHTAVGKLTISISQHDDPPLCICLGLLLEVLKPNKFVALTFILAWLGSKGGNCEAMDYGITCSSPRDLASEPLAPLTPPQNNNTGQPLGTQQQQQ